MATKRHEALAGRRKSFERPYRRSDLLFAGEKCTQQNNKLRYSSARSQGGAAEPNFDRPPDGSTRRLWTPRKCLPALQRFCASSWPTVWWIGASSKARWPQKARKGSGRQTEILRAPIGASDALFAGENARSKTTNSDIAVQSQTGSPSFLRQLFLPSPMPGIHSTFRELAFMVKGEVIEFVGSQRYLPENARKAHRLFQSVTADDADEARIVRGAILIVPPGAAVAQPPKNRRPIVFGRLGNRPSFYPCPSRNPW